MATAARGCGERVAGGVYIALHLVPGGTLSADSFIVDPPQLIDVEALGLSPRGVTILPVTTVQGVKTHYVYDIVGREHYPNPADFVEEVRRQGLSRRIAKNIDFSLLDANSRIVVIHERAWINEHERYQKERTDGRAQWCPRDIPQHMRDDYDGMCAALWWYDIEEGLDPNLPNTPGGKLTYGSQISTDQPGVQMHIRRSHPYAVVRQMPSFSYRGHHRPIGVTPTYQTAAFMSFPIRTIEVVYDHAGGTHTESINKAKRATGVEVREVPE